MTAIEQLIDELKKCKQLHNPSGAKEERMVCGAYTNAIIIAGSFLPIEKQQIVDAWSAGNESELMASKKMAAEAYIEKHFNK